MADMEKQLPESCWLVASNIFPTIWHPVVHSLRLDSSSFDAKARGFPTSILDQRADSGGGNHTCHAIADFKMQNTFGFEEVCLYLLVACWGVPLSHWVRSCQMSYCSMVVTCKKEECLETSTPGYHFAGDKVPFSAAHSRQGKEEQSHSHDHLHVHLRRPKAIFWTIYPMVMHTEWCGMGKGKNLRSRVTRSVGGCHISLQEM